MEKFGLQTVEIYCKNVLNLRQHKFTFQNIKLSFILKLLKKVWVNKHVRIDSASGKLLKDGVDIEPSQ